MLTILDCLISAGPGRIPIPIAITYCVLKVNVEIIEIVELTV